MILTSMFVAMIAAGAFIKIPVPIVPFTLQFLFTMLAGILLGGKDGFRAVVIYIFLGLIGLPIFAEGGGFAYIFKPSFGYIIGFAVASYVTGTITNKNSEPTIKRLLCANFRHTYRTLAIIFILFYFGSPWRYFTLYFRGNTWKSTCPNY